MIDFGNEDAEVTGIDFQTAYDKLASLESADVIASFFVGQGIKAYRCEPHACAISVWMNEQTGLMVRTNNYRTRAVENESLMFVTIPGTDKDLTVPMTDFVVRFDNGEYPELEQG